MHTHTFQFTLGSKLASLILPYHGKTLSSLVIGAPTQFTDGKSVWVGANIREQLPTDLQPIFDQAIVDGRNNLKEVLFIPPWETLETVQSLSVG